MKIMLSLNNENCLYDYKSMGIDTYLLGCTHSFYAPYTFSLDDIKRITTDNDTCHFYVLINALYDECKIGDVESFILSLKDTNVEGIIFQDLGVLQIVKENSLPFKMIYNPETLNTNVKTINTLAILGVSGAIISRVIPMDEALAIKEEATIPVAFCGHGVEYVAATKRELITNYDHMAKLNLSKNHVYKIVANNSEMPFLMYEDEKGTHFFTESRLYTLDLFNTIKDFDYLFIETMMMDDQESIEVASIYSDCIVALENGTYDRDVKAFMPLLRKLGKPLSQGFLFDNTVYKLDEIRKLDDERNK